jgi:hypothetical protein
VTLLQRTMLRDLPREAGPLDGLALAILPPRPGEQHADGGAQPVAAGKAPKRGMKVKLSLSGISIVDKPAMAVLDSEGKTQ